MYNKGKNMNSGIYGHTSPSEMKSPSYNYQETSQKKHTLNVNAPVFTSVYEMITNKCTASEAMDEFRKNGIDCPYDPDEDNIWRKTPNEIKPSPTDLRLTTEELEVLQSLPESFIRKLLKSFGCDGVKVQRRAFPIMECRFCKNNGERESYYRSHQLKEASGRVLCPVLRALVCRICGATGDYAHTIKYCPHSTDEERFKSSAILRTVRMASGRYRVSAGQRESRVSLGTVQGHIGQSGEIANAHVQGGLDAMWARLEEKLS